MEQAFGKPLEKVGNITVGDCCQTKFWSNSYCGDCPLKTSFPVLFVLLFLMQSGELWDGLGTQGHWSELGSFFSSVDRSQR